MTGQSPKKRHGKTLAVVTAWRDHLDLAPDYFIAVERANPDQLVIVDDGSAEPLPFAALRIPPSGFCIANNRGLDLVETDAVLFLNNDIAAMRTDWLEEIRDAIQPGVMLGRIIESDHGDVDGVRYPYVDGWCCGMMTKDARDLGGWDEIYDRAGPAYFSDNAFSLQARLHGMTLRELFPGIRHKGGQTGGSGIKFTIALAANRQVWEQQVRELTAA